FAFPADPPANRRRHAGAGHGARSRSRHDPMARSGDGGGIRDGRNRGPMQAAVEAGLGDALVRARRRLRNGGQGPDRFGQAVVADRAGSWGRAASRIQLRALPRRERAEDFEDQGNGLTIEQWLAYASPESLS